MPKKWLKAKFLESRQESPRVRRFWFEICEEEAFRFKAGQFITFDLPTGAKRIDRWRSYSIASTSDQSSVIELCILYMKGGRASEYFFNTMQQGDILSFQGPKGIFTLEEKPSHHVFICTGTGVVPYRSMLWDVYYRGLKGHSFHLIFGARNAEEILYQEEFDRLGKLLDNFKVDYCLSREDHPDHHKGYVHQVYENHYPQSRKDRLFYLCGWSQMIDDAEKKLRDLGNSSDQIRIELYG